MAMAMAGAVALPDGKNYAISGNWGTFEGANAVSFGAIGKVTDNLFVTGGVGAGLEEGTTGGRAGAMWAW